VSQRSKNLLEAFNQSKAPEKSAQPVTPARGSAPRVGGPFADAASAQPKVAAPAPEVRTRAAGAQPRLVDAAARWRLLAMAGVIALTFFLLGRASVPGVQAAGGAIAPAGPQQPSANSGAQNSSAGKTIEERLFDKSNKCTILAVTYASGKNNEALASAAWARLLDLGLPAAKPYENAEKRQIVILIGAAPKVSDLDDLLVRVKDATTDAGRKDFSTARTVPIDTYIQRN
jgi:hypothetical protein